MSDCTDYFVTDAISEVADAMSARQWLGGSGAIKRLHAKKEGRVGPWTLMS